MSKTTLIIKREYLTRVRKRTFIISTILFPLLYLGLIFGSSYIAANSGTHLNVAVIDSSGFFDLGKIECDIMKVLVSSYRIRLINMNQDGLPATLSHECDDVCLGVPSML